MKRKAWKSPELNLETCSESTGHPNVTSFQMQYKPCRVMTDSTAEQLFNSQEYSVVYN